MLKVRTLFSGIGSPEIALRNLEIPFKLIDFCEVDKYAVQSYCAVHGVSPSKNLGDITKVWGRNLPYADMMVWGFPCTSISVAGKQEGIIEGKTASGLYYEGLRILKETKPKYSIIENVKNLTGKKYKAEFEQMLKDIEELGYNNYWKILNAKDYGIPQNRERVFIISIRKDADTKTFKFPKGFNNGLRLKHLLESEVDEKYYIKGKRLNIIKQNLGDVFKDNFLIGSSQKNAYKGDDSVCPALTSAMGQGGGQTPMIKMVGMLEMAGNEQVRRVYSSEGISLTLNTMKGGNRQPKIMELLQQDDSIYRIRKLTPKECWRLMGFKDEDFQMAKDVGVSDSQLYKQAGNSIVSNVLFYIFKNLLQAEIATIYEEEKELS